VRSELLAAVKKLRLALGDTQQQFAARLGLAISTVVRYELTRPPKGRALRQLADVAHKNREFELAFIFHTALVEELGWEMPNFEEPDPEIEAALRLVVRNPGRFARELKAIAKAFPEEVQRTKAELQANRPYVLSSAVGNTLGVIQESKAKLGRKGKGAKK
jgi:transcriptional regulator with XRE-family HTH domain